jgi:hypothetical protein
MEMKTDNLIADQSFLPGPVMTALRQIFSFVATKTTQYNKLTDRQLQFDLQVVRKHFDHVFQNLLSQEEQNLPQPMSLAAALHIGWSAWVKQEKEQLIILRALNKIRSHLISALLTEGVFVVTDIKKDYILATAAAGSTTLTSDLDVNLIAGPLSNAHVLARATFQAFVLLWKVTSGHAFDCNIYAPSWGMLADYTPQLSCEKHLPWTFVLPEAWFVFTIPSQSLFLQEFRYLMAKLTSLKGFKRQYEHYTQSDSALGIFNEMWRHGKMLEATRENKDEEEWNRQQYQAAIKRKRAFVNLMVQDEKEDCQNPKHTIAAFRAFAEHTLQMLFYATEGYVGFSTINHVLLKLNKKSPHPDLQLNVFDYGFSLVENWIDLMQHMHENNKTATKSEDETIAIILKLHKYLYRIQDAYAHFLHLCSCEPLLTEPSAQCLMREYHPSLADHILEVQQVRSQSTTISEAKDVDLKKIDDMVQALIHECNPVPPTIQFSSSNTTQWQQYQDTLIGIFMSHFHLVFSTLVVAPILASRH